jgi:hypothetical protein
MPYDIRQNYGDCKGFAVVGPDGTIRGCHPSKKDAEEQRVALYSVEDKVDKGISVGSMVSWNSSGGRAEGKVKRIVRDGKVEVPGSSFTITGTSDNPAVLITVYRDGEPTDTVVGHRMDSLRGIGKAYTGCGCAECKAEDISCSECDTCTPAVMKADTYTPTSGMQSAAKRALKWKEDGKATGAGTPVGWTRARQLANRESLSLSTVKRMYSFFSRHEVDKKGKGFYSGPEFPSNGRIMWDAWGGDAGFSWSRKIVERENSKKVWEGSIFDLNKYQD